MPPRNMDWGSSAMRILSGASPMGLWAKESTRPCPSCRVVLGTFRQGRQRCLGILRGGGGNGGGRRGIEKLLWEQLGNKNVSSWEKVTQLLPDSWGHLKWNVPIYVTGWKFLNCKIPFRCVRTEMRFCVNRNKKWYLNECVFQQMRDEMYVLSRKQQNMMNEIKKVKQEWSMDQKVLLKSKLNEMNSKYDMIQRERDMLKEERNFLKTKEKEWELKEHEFKTENTSLKIKLKSMAVVDKILKRMIGSNRKLRG
ncbi:hypothetical protein TNCV_2430981 [Trichonephila clavipes]|nr:hypothetical protein TNCV_2430981 [Trichonephila clavipes]